MNRISFCNAWSLFLLPVFMLMGAVAAQYFLGWEPCTICVEIRAMLSASALFSLVYLAVRGLAPRFSAVALLGIIGTSGTALFLNAKVSLLEHHVIEAFSCSPFPFYFHSFPLQDWLPYVFTSGGVCGENDFAFLSISFSSWTLMGVGAYFLLVLLTALRHVLRRL